MIGFSVPAAAAAVLAPTGSAFGAVTSSGTRAAAVDTAAATATTATVTTASVPAYGVSAAARAASVAVSGRDFAQSNYCWYQPAVTSLKNVAYTIAPMSSTKASAVPGTKGATNPFSLLRIGPNGGQSGVQTVIDGLTLTGTKQPYSGSNPTKAGHNYHGLTVYWGRKAIIRNSTFIAAAWGDSNSPPGETFQIMGYRDTDTYISNVEVDGRTADGTRVGGSPIGFNGSTRPVVEDSYLHHSLVSSLTFSTAGATPSTSNATSDPTTRRVRIEHNANTKMATGYRFTGINHEHVFGDITHFMPTIQIDWTEWTASHMFFGTWLSSAKIHIIVDPASISGGHSNNRGALTLAIPKVFNGQTNRQLVSDVVVRLPSGARLQPYVITGAQSAPMPISRSTHFVVNTG